MSPFIPPSSAPAPRPRAVPARRNRIPQSGASPRANEADPTKRRGERQDGAPAEALGDDPAAEGPRRIRDRVHEVVDADPGIGPGRTPPSIDRIRAGVSSPLQPMRTNESAAEGSRPGGGRDRCGRASTDAIRECTAHAADGQIGGRCQPPSASSTTLAAARTMSSRHGGPMSWTPIGSPSGDVPPRTTADGQPVRLWTSLYVSANADV